MNNTPKILTLLCSSLVAACAHGDTTANAKSDVRTLGDFVRSTIEKMGPGAQGLISAYTQFELPASSGEFTIVRQRLIQGVAFGYVFGSEKCLSKESVRKAFLENGFVEQKLLAAGTNEYTPGQSMAFEKTTPSGAIPVSLEFSGATNFRCASSMSFNLMNPLKKHAT